MSKYNSQNKIGITTNTDVCSCGRHKGIGKASPHERAQQYNWHRTTGKLYELHMARYLDSYEADHGHLDSESFLFNDSRFVHNN